eukprot:CAMPEP_0169433376 /NCGR_PEP_ID=MMETSP1042-20121227/3976_1 /TAXON_ID=464988 /ORGANISM="Hemiselmis andersenii, Strain CCMP1180" /LENGTH=113 /DNA_ID=CAMNT_0009543907 /DNA_START=244 /DNA_END=583 /DNA_ORIENTATION=-
MGGGEERAASLPPVWAEGGKRAEWSGSKRRKSVIARDHLEPRFGCLSVMRGGKKIQNVVMKCRGGSRGGLVLLGTLQIKAPPEHSCKKGSPTLNNTPALMLKTLQPKPPSSEK